MRCASRAPDVFIELVDLLRCPHPHGPGTSANAEPLIASSGRSAARHILDGELGCAVCHARFPIEDGVARFPGAPPAAPAPGGIRPDIERATRIAALLGLTDAGGFVLLSGAAGVHGELVRAVAADVALVLLNPPADVEAGPGVSIVRSGPALPFADGVFRAAADASDPAHPWLESIARTVKTGGRLLAPSGRPLPAGFSRLAADDLEWLARRETRGPLVSLQRANG